MKQSTNIRPRALAFDVFGTVVDWRSAIARESRFFLQQIGRPDLEPARFADRWRAHYQPAMAAVRDAERPFVVLDVLHREMLEAVLAEFGVEPAGVAPAILAEWTRAWHWLYPWPVAV